MERISTDYNFRYREKKDINIRWITKGMSSSNKAREMETRRKDAGEKSEPFIPRWSSTM